MSDRETLKSAFAATPQCLTPDQLEALLEGSHSNPHLAECPRCQTELAMLKSFESGAPLPDEGAAVAWISSHLDRQLTNIKSGKSALRSVGKKAELKESWWAKMFGTGGMRWVLPVAAVAAIGVASAVLLHSPKAPELQANAGGQPAIYRSQEVHLVSPIGAIKAVPEELRWQAYAGAASYQVVVMEVDHSQLWSIESKELTTNIPASVRAKILPGKTILWQVTALDAESRVLVTSQVQRFVFDQ